jgi:YVTN family beta-propeller protein
MDYMAASPDGKTLYVNRIETLGVGRAKNIGDWGEIIAIDTATDDEKWRMRVDGMPHHMSISHDGKLMFLPYYNTWWTAVIDLEKREEIKRLFTGHGSHGTKISSDGKTLYVGSMMNDFLSIVDIPSLEVVDIIPFRDGVRPFVMTKDEKTMYVQQSQMHGFWIVDLEKREKVKKFMLPELPSDVKPPEMYPHNVNHGLALSPDEELLLVNGSIVNYVAAYKHPELELIQTIPVGEDPNAIAFSKDGRFAYVTNRQSDDLSVISTESLEEVKRIPLGDLPQRMVVIDVPE